MINLRGQEMEKLSLTANTPRLRDSKIPTICDGMTKFCRLFLGTILLLAANCAGADDGAPWFTGSLNSTGATALPAGHFLAEPYLVDAMVPADHLHRAESLNLLLYGVSDDLTVGVIPRFSYRERPELGDVTARAQYRFTPYDPETGFPSLAMVLNQTFPTGRHDNLDTKSDDGNSGGAYVTSLGFLSDDYFTLPGDHLVRARLDLAYGVSSQVGVENRSVYGTGEGFSGHAAPGTQFSSTLAFEVALTQRWAFAVDLDYQHAGHSSVWGGDLHWEDASAQSADIVPSMEYNFTALTGLIVGVELPVWQRNGPPVVIPMAALNCIF